MGLAELSIIRDSFRCTVLAGVATVLFCATAAGAKLLTGGVEQSDYLSPVTPQLTAAVEQARQQPYVEWFMIQPWMAGEFTKDGDLTVTLTDLRTGATSKPNEWTQNRLTRRFGHRKDRAGNIWWANLLPSEKDGETSGMEDKFLIIARKLERSTPEYLITRTRFLVTETTPNGREVLQQYQQEALNHFLPLPDGQVENHSYNRVFDRSGRPERDGELMSKWRKIGPFAEVKERQGIDLEQSLNSYLQSHGLPNLMTKQSQASPVGSPPPAPVTPQMNPYPAPPPAYPVPAQSPPFQL